VIQERNGRTIKTDFRVSHYRDREDDEDRDDRYYGRDDD